MGKADTANADSAVVKAKPGGLGRGLAALLGDEQPVVASTQGDSPSASENHLPIDLLVPNKDQPRQHFDDAALAALASSIKAQGVLQPILVRPLPTDPGRYEIVAGERRWRAAQRAQIHRVPVVIRDLDDGHALELAIVENVQREDLNPIDEAVAYRRLADDFGHTQEDIAKAVGKSRSHVANLMRLLSLPTGVRALVAEGALSMGHARALLASANPQALAERVLADSLTVRQTEALAMAPETKSVGRKAVRRTKDADTVALEQDIAQALGLQVSLDHNGTTGGSVKISYKTLEQLDELCQRLCVPQR